MPLLLGVCADTPEQQLAYLHELGSPESADERALEFDDVAAAAVAEACLLSDEQAEMVHRVADRLEEISGPARAELWTPNALRSAWEWQEIRVTASRLLEALERPAT